jgi:hypothetical protein
MPNSLLLKKLENSGGNIIPETDLPDSPTNNTKTNKCGVICQKKKKRKVLLIGFGVLLVSGISYFILKKK